MKNKVEIDQEYITYSKTFKHYHLLINGKEIEAGEAAECHCCTDPATGDTRKFAAISFQGKNYWQELLDYETEKEL